MCFKVHVLGHFRLLKLDEPIQVPRRLRKPQELLQALIALGGTEVGAGALIDALWPGSPLLQCSTEGSVRERKCDAVSVP
jgi:DNA-binding SARP family transcriptional activator